MGEEGVAGLCYSPSLHAFVAASLGFSFCFFSALFFASFNPKEQETKKW